MADQKQSASRALPKNIRQIGTSTGSTRVYLEDYVYTYLHMREEQDEWSRRGFALIGAIERERDCTRYFISGLVCLRDHFFREGILEFNDDTWAYIYQEVKKYYDNLDIVGWGQDAGGISANMITEIERSHKKNFNIQKNVLFLLDTVEHDEAFYVFEKNMIQRREGYYVYYEKNPQMQEYMIQTRKSRELDIAEDAIKEPAEPLVRSYRENLMEKKEQIAARKWNGVLYTTSMLLVLSVCVLGVSTVNNVEKMQNLETRVRNIAGQGGQADVSPAMSQAADQKDGSKDGQAVESESKPKADADENSRQPSAKSGEDRTAEKEEEKNKDKEKDVNNKDINNKDINNKDINDKKEKAEKADTPKDADLQETAALNEAQTYLLQGYYIVKKGDSLVGISKRIYGTAEKAQKICDLNGIEDMDKIYAGQKLELP